VDCRLYAFSLSMISTIGGDRLFCCYVGACAQPGARPVSQTLATIELLIPGASLSNL
jgi:hypothetical protein